MAASDFRWADIVARVARDNSRLLVLDDPGGYRVQQRRELMEEFAEKGAGQRVVLPPPPDVKHDVEAAAGRVLAFYVQGYTTLVGVPKKGLSVLREIVQNNLPGATCLSSRNMTKADIKGKRVLVFDDMVHEGKELVAVLTKVLAYEPKEVAVVILWASQQGMQYYKTNLPAEQRKLVSIGTQEVPEDGFWLIFQLSVSPLLYSLKAGAVSNRPTDQLVVAPAEGRTLPPQQVAYEILQAATQVKGVETVAANAPLDGLDWETFHGEMELSKSTTDHLMAEMGDETEKLEYGKIRLFIHPSQPFMIHLAGCLCTEGFAPNANAAEGEVDRRDNDWSRKMLDLIVPKFQEELKRRGLTSTRRPIEMG